ncbi:MAG: hypothetical protein LBH92_00890 [Bacteroidales bacterium]|nr:hypothetical protein [Bacteroidales bacterium]
MDFIDDILKCSSVSVVGLEKNTGKTETLNYIVKRLKDSSKQIAITSIGIDGESIDSVYQTKKPEIDIFEDMIFVTSERFFKQRKFPAEIIAVSDRHTALGRLVTAQAKATGKVLLSGPADTIWLQDLIQSLRTHNVDLTLVDGALSRLSLASPTVADGMILATGAALSSNISQLVKQTKFAYKLINLEQADAVVAEKLLPLQKGIWEMDSEGVVHNLNIPSVFTLYNDSGQLFKYGTMVFVAGAISDALLKNLRNQKQIKEITLIIKDFTKAFITEEIYNSFIKKGGRIKVLKKSKLVTITINPTAPKGRNLDSEELQNALQKALELPVFDVRRL